MSLWLEIMHSGNPGVCYSVDSKKAECGDSANAFLQKKEFLRKKSTDTSSCSADVVGSPRIDDHRTRRKDRFFISKSFSNYWKCCFSFQPNLLFCNCVKCYTVVISLQTSRFFFYLSAPSLVLCFAIHIGLQPGTGQPAKVDCI